MMMMMVMMIDDDDDDDVQENFFCSRTLSEKFRQSNRNNSRLKTQDSTSCPAILMQVVAGHLNITSVMADVAIVKLFGCKKFQNAIQSGERGPGKLVKTLKDTMETCKSLGLVVPANLQAQALYFVAGTDNKSS